MKASAEPRPSWKWKVDGVLLKLCSFNGKMFSKLKKSPWLRADHASSMVLSQKRMTMYVVPHFNYILGHWQIWWFYRFYRFYPWFYVLPYLLHKYTLIFLIDVRYHELMKKGTQEVSNNSPNIPYGYNLLRTPFTKRTTFSLWFSLILGLCKSYWM